MWTISRSFCSACCFCSAVVFVRNEKKMAERRNMTIDRLVNEFSTTNSPSKTGSPYKRTPPIQCKCLGKKAITKTTEFKKCEQTNVIKAVKTKTMIHYGLCDYQSAIKATADTAVLSALDVDMEPERCYILRNYGVLPAKNNSPMQIFLKPGTTIFHAGDMTIPDNVQANCKVLVHPESRTVTINEATANILDRLITLEGKVLSVSLIY